MKGIKRFTIFSILLCLAGYLYGESVPVQKPIGLTGAAIDFLKVPDQRVIWAILIISLVVFFILRIFRMDFPVKDIHAQTSNVFLDIYKNWFTYIGGKNMKPSEMKILRQKLTRILVTIYASRKRIPANYLVTGAFKTKTISLPENVYSFLFDETPGKSFWKILICKDRFTAKEKNDCRNHIKECLEFLEKYMEIKDEYEQHR